MSTGNWFKVSAEHEFRYTEKWRSLLITKSKTSGEQEVLYGLVFGFSHRHSHVCHFAHSREFQSTCFAVMLSAIKPGKLPPK